VSPKEGWTERRRRKSVSALKIQGACISIPRHPTQDADAQPNPSASLDGAPPVVSDNLSPAW
jgi:hypothetical protein